MASYITKSHHCLLNHLWSDQRKHQSSVSLAFVWGIHRWAVNSPHKWPVMRKMFSFNDVIMACRDCIHTNSVNICSGSALHVRFWSFIWINHKLSSIRSQQHNLVKYYLTFNFSIVKTYFKISSTKFLLFCTGANELDRTNTLFLQGWSWLKPRFNLSVLLTLGTLLKQIH